jgi:signal peptidase I
MHGQDSHPTRAPGDGSHRSGRERQTILHPCLLLLIGVLVVRTFGVEPYRVPTGSMAPALLGTHKSLDCPRCGYPVVVGRLGDARPNGADAYPAAVCPNCGCRDLRLDDVPECGGDRLLVNKLAYQWDPPRRWEMAVFRCPFDAGRIFVKRVVGLPGETLHIRDGDVYVDGRLARKSLTEFKALRLPVFDNTYQPRPGGWAARWCTEPANDPRVSLDGKVLRLDGTDGGECWLAYRHWDLDEHAEQPVRDVYAYNGDDRRPEPVHDFMAECDLEVHRGAGWVALAVTDGRERITVELAVGEGDSRIRGDHTTLRTATDCHLAPGRTYHVELAFVDRRATLAVDGRCPCVPVDLEPVGDRPPVTRPARLGCRGVAVVVRNFRLFRDVHYTAAGRHGVRGAVRLGPGQYFVLGDNSPSSDDSRFWKDPAVPESHFLGRPFLVHLPNRVTTWDALGRHWQYEAVDWGRVRWVR